jgi:hypothetical protein
MMRFRGILLFLAFGSIHIGYCAAVPSFVDFPATDVFHGKPVPPILTTPADRLFRTRIREGAKKGPNFAGHYTIAVWGCGSLCTSMVVVNANTGKVFPGPFDILGHFWIGYYLGDTTDKDAPYLDYRLTSNLLVVRGCPEDADEKCATYFYKWTNRGFRLLTSIPVNRLSNQPTIK